MSVKFNSAIEVKQLDLKQRSSGVFTTGTMHQMVKNTTIAVDHNVHHVFLIN